MDTVVGFTGSSIWQYVAMFPPVPDELIEAGYQDFADRWNPILDVFDECGVRFAHEVHPSEIAYDYWTTVRTLEAIGHRPAFGLNWDPTHMMWQGIDPVSFIWDFKDRIYHVDCKDTRIRLPAGATASWAPTCPGATRAAAGTSSPPAAATSLGGLLPRPRRDRLQRPHLGRVGGRRHGPPPRRPRGAGVPPGFDFEPPTASFDAAFSQ